jgi:hypothetical protein
MSINVIARNGSDFKYVEIFTHDLDSIKISQLFFIYMQT